jgi:RNA polymerase sigma factor (sigma-70 family)
MEEAQLAELFRQFAPLVHARARRIVGDDADDIVQEVFVRLYRRPPDLKKVASWIYTTSTNLCVERLRYRKRRHKDWERDVKTHVLANEKASLDELLASKSLCAQILARQDRRTQKIVMLVYFDEMSQEQAAKTLGLTRKTVSVRLKKFKEDARKLVVRWKS